MTTAIQRAPRRRFLQEIFAIVLALFCALPAAALSGNYVPPALATVTDRGRVPAATEQTFTVMLKLRDQAGFERAVDALYDPESATYHQWFTDADFARYAPTAADLATVQGELLRQGFTAIFVDPLNFSLRVRGTVGTAERAFHTELHTYSARDTTFQAPVVEPWLSGEAGALVDCVVGLNRAHTRPLFLAARDPLTHKPLFSEPVTDDQTADHLLSEITSIAMLAPEKVTFRFYGNPNSTVGTYSGNVVNTRYQKTVSYTPKDLQQHYGLSSLIAQGYDGHGQTIALVEAFGYARAQADANVAAAAFDQPPLTAENFRVIYPEGVPANPNLADETGWTEEIALDIQSAHAIAPGANILVVASAGQDDEDQIASLQYIITHQLANAVSGSWESELEYFAGSAQENAFNRVLALGSAAGISFQFSTGDSGDNGVNAPVGDVSLPSDSPYATAVGGTSILNDPSGGRDIVTGWGNDLVTLSYNGPTDPPNVYSQYNGGAGGGESVYFAKPPWQKSLPGSGRQLPDVSALADPYTGFPLIVTKSGTEMAEAGVGGTSLASPIFTAIWAIADQYNGKPLGHASPLVARLKAGEITDVVGTSDLNASDVTGTVTDKNGSTTYSATKLFALADSYQTQTEFVSALWSTFPGIVYAITFGTDSSLTVTQGWDNVTGYGEPNGLPFIQGVTGKTTGAPRVE